MQKQPRKVGKKARALFHKQKGLCHYCRTPMTLKRGSGAVVTVDHVLPKSKGGTRHDNNTVGACWACNNARGNTPYEIFLARVKANGRPERKPNDVKSDIRIAREEREKPILVGDAPWKKQKLPKGASVDGVFKANTLADALIAAGFVKKEEG